MAQKDIDKVPRTENDPDPSWNLVLGQGRVKRVLQNGIMNGRTAHAYLFFGPYGTGKRAAAIAFTQALKCSNVDVPADRAKVRDRIRRMIHPDVRFFFPMPKDTPTEDVVERLRLMGENPYATVDFVRRPLKRSGNKQAIYPIRLIHDDIRPIVDYRAFEGGYKVVVLTGADALGSRTGNAFLKLLEEPSSHTVFILTTERPDMLLPTVLSRCQPIRFEPLSADVIESALIEREGLPREEAAPVARMADGSYSDALNLLEDEESRAFRGRIVEFMRAAYANDVLKLVREIDWVSAMNRDHVKLYLNHMLTWVRDLILVREMGEEAAIINVDIRHTIVSFCDKLPDARLEQMVDLIEEGIMLIGRNIRISFVMMGLASSLRRSMMGQDAVPLATPLADRLAALYG